MNADFIRSARFFLATIALPFLLNSPALGSDVMMPRAAALGNSTHASPLFVDAVFLNPSYAAFVPSFSFSTYYAPFSSSDSSAFGRNYTLAVIDGRSPLFQAGAGYTVRDDGRMVHMGIGKGFAEVFGAGLGGKMYLSASGNIPTVFEMTASVTYIMTGWLQMAVISDNLIENSTSLSAGLYREITLGTKVNVENVANVFIDPHWTPSLGANAWGYEAGIELTPMTDLAVRFGAFKNSSIAVYNGRGTGFSTGIGWMAPKLSLDYAWMRILDSPAGVPASSVHVFGANIFF
jgi:hypothetical protein